MYYSRQSPQGFLKSGGFSGIYKGLGAAALGSAPGAALFFSTYDTLKHVLGKSSSSSEGISTSLPTHFVHMTAASLAEVVMRMKMAVVGADLHNNF